MNEEIKTLHSLLKEFTGKYQIYISLESSDDFHVKNFDNLRDLFLELICLDREKCREFCKYRKSTCENKQFIVNVYLITDFSEQDVHNSLDIDTPILYSKLY
jgi:hypothetical protein